MGPAADAGGPVDLTNGPVVVEIPPGPVMGVVNDLNQRYVMDLGLPGPDAGKGGRDPLFLTVAGLQSALNTMLQTPGSLGYVNATTYGNATVTVNGAGVYQVTFGGTLATTLVPLMVVEDVTGRHALQQRFHVAQSYLQDDPWAERGKRGVDAHEFTPLAVLG